MVTQLDSALPLNILFQDNIKEVEELGLKVNQSDFCVMEKLCHDASVSSSIGKRQRGDSWSQNVHHGTEQDRYRLCISVWVGDGVPLLAFLRVMVVHLVRISRACGLGGTLGAEELLKMLGSETLGVILPPGTIGLRRLAGKGGGVRLRSSSGPLELTLRFSLELPREEANSSLSLKLKSVLSLMLPSLSIVRLLLRPSPSISTMMAGGAACFGVGSVPVPSAPG